MAAGGGGVSGSSGAEQYGFSKALTDDLHGYLKARIDPRKRTAEVAALLKGIEEKHNVPLTATVTKLGTSGLLGGKEEDTIMNIARGVFFTKLSIPEKLIDLLYRYAGAIMRMDHGEVEDLEDQMKREFGFSPTVVLSKVGSMDVDAWVAEAARTYKSMGAPASGEDYTLGAAYRAEDVAPRGGSPVGTATRGLPPAVQAEFLACIKACRGGNEVEGDRLSALINARYKFDPNDVLPMKLKESDEYYLDLLASAYVKAAARRT